MSFSEYRFLVRSDLYRYGGKTDLFSFLRNLMFNPGFIYSLSMRTAYYTRNHFLLKYGFFHLSWMFHRHFSYVFGIAIPYSTKIDSGLNMGHFGGIVVNGNAVIGKNCNISQGVTIGRTNRGKNAGVPTIGDNVYIGPGAKIIGKIAVGDNVAIGANCVVTKDIPNNAVVAGIPGRVLSSEGSEGYVMFTDY